MKFNGTNPRFSIYLLIHGSNIAGTVQIWIHKNINERIKIYYQKDNIKEENFSTLFFKYTSNNFYNI